MPLLLLLVTGCPGDDGVGADGSGSGSSTGGTTTGSASDPGATSVVPGQTSSSDSGTTVDPDTSGGMDSMSFIGPGSSGPVGELPNGGFCMTDTDCMSGHCAGIPDIGGVCSECTMDADCEVGTCVFEISAGYSVCTDGSVGVDCMTDEGCAEGLVCAPVFGDFSPTRCSECRADVPCPDGQSCAVNTDNGLLDAYLGCVDNGTVPLGETCPVVDGVGNGAICASGECGVIDFFGFQLGVCSECDSDADCPDGQSCSSPGFDGMLTPGTCG
jgi:hypothetical protein